MTDIDHFKGIQRSLRARRRRPGSCKPLRVRSSGLRATDLLCRYGGEEFCILLPGLDAKQAAEIAERLRSEVERRAGPSVRTSEGLNVTSSFGVAELRGDFADPAVLIDEADKALYVEAGAEPRDNLGSRHRRA